MTDSGTTNHDPIESRHRHSYPNLRRSVAQRLDHLLATVTDPTEWSGAGNDLTGLNHRFGRAVRAL